MSTEPNWMSSAVGATEPIRSQLPGAADIAESWRRSALCGIRRSDLVPRVTNAGHANPNRLVECARPVVEQLATLHDGAAVAVVLASAAGQVLQVTTSDVLLRHRLGRLGLLPGASWAEEHIGTTPLGLSLMSGAPAAVAKGECFLQAHQDLVGGAAPITHPLTRRTQGVFGMVALADLDPRMLAGTAGLAASAVERALELRDSGDEHRLLAGYLREARSDGVPVLAFGSHVELANPSAQLIDTDDRAVLHQQAEKVVRDDGWGTVTLSLADGRRLQAVARRAEGVGSGDGVVVRVTAVGAERRRTDRRAEPTGESPLAEAFVGRSRACAHVRSRAERITVDTPMVVVTGEPGTGKFLLARLIAERARPGAAVVSLDAAAAEQASNAGVVAQVRAELSGGGSVVIVRHAEMLQGWEHEALAARAADAGRLCLLLTRTERQMADEDLRPAESGVELRVPPIRERPEDVLDLVPHLVREIAPDVTVAPALLRALVRHDWPGNASELAGLVRGVVHQFHGAELSLLDLPSAYLNPGRGLGRMEQVERLTIIRALQESAGNKLRAAQSLGIGRATLYRKLRAYRINLDDEILLGSPTH
ncbi:helix-turn-helix domain-containing protein [Streptomyces blattellae]|uniref:helix-turn-helix domain-containing protein n=1 Tax=Streptomyces blattellae TaxID=2569855 RepID=UPI0012B7C7FA|nr:helix-turn-helix domain-containing protein [Streptomyces blattellae]